MRLELYRKIVPLGELGERADRFREAGQSVVLCHGCFDIVHPGHLRYLQFAGSQGDVLVVSLTGDDAIEKGDGTRPQVPQELRAENLAALQFVDLVVIAEGPTAEPVIRTLRPRRYVKGREYERSRHGGFLAEKALVERLGGEVVFSSGDVVMSSTGILENMAPEQRDDAANLGVLCRRWRIDAPWVRQTVLGGFAGKRIAVVGDTLCDRYMLCEPAGVSVASEAPVLSVSPTRQSDYLGGAAIVAAHLKRLGAEPLLLTTLGPQGDNASDQSRATLDQLGVRSLAPATRQSLPVKQRFVVDGQKVLKVNHGRPQPLDHATQQAFVSRLIDACEGTHDALDAVIFTDFGFGTLTTSLLEAALPELRPRVPIIAGDTSGPRRSLMAMHRADLLTPTEAELRGIGGDPDGSLPSLASRIMQKLACPNLMVTLGARGTVLFRPREAEPAEWFKARLRSDYLPSLADRVVDVVGAGDAMLATATLAMTTGADLAQSAYLGSAAAALAVARLGNAPIDADTLLHWAHARPELHVNPTMAGVTPRLAQAG